MRSDLTLDAATAALQQLSDGVLVVCDDEVVLANRALSRFTKSDLLGGPPPSWLPAASGPTEVEVDGRRALVTVAPCAIGTGRGGAVVTVRDACARSALAHRADHDGLTGLLNHAAFRARLAAEARRLAPSGRPLSLVIVDLDHFKAVNDQHGHPAGDRVLVEAAGRIAAEARGVDVVGRIGGEEFAWLLPDEPAGAAVAAAQRLRAALRGTPFAGGLEVTASVGVCDLATAGSVEALVGRADEALYWAKRHGRDAVLAWSPEAAGRLAWLRAVEGTRGERFRELASLSPDRPHAERVAELAMALAERLDWDPEDQVRLHQAARLHDLGKLVLPDGLLARPDTLTAFETEHVRQHPRIGAGLVAGVLDDEQADWILHHHERWDGGGYPGGCAGRAIPEGAQLLAIADAWDAMSTDRPYRPALAPDAALAELDRCAGTHLRPDAGELLRAARNWWTH